jgi:hypothetical protein
MIYTLDYIEKEANLIAGYWNGSDERFIDGNGENRTDEEAQIASEVLETIKELRVSLNRLSI